VGTDTINVTAETKGFDTSVAPSTGDLFYDFAVDPSALGSFQPVVVDPGESAVIDVTITPSGASGTLVNGTLYLDAAIAGVSPYGQVSGDELAGLPYSYRIK
jgi:hypothetical protein